MFISRFSLVTSYWPLATALFAILLISGCGGEETADKPMVEAIGDEKRNEPVPTSTIYYPMTVGSRWVYRNPDGSEWAREVTETEQFGSNLYHFFSYNPPIQDNQLKCIESAVYATFRDRLILRGNSNDINDAVWQTIRESGSVSHHSWSLGHTFRDGVWRRKQKYLDSLVYLYFYRATVDWHSEFALLRFPLVPGQTYKSLNLRLSGRNEGGTHNHAFEAEGVILGKVGDGRELVETPAGAFEDCLKIQYEAKQPALETKEFRNHGGLPAQGKSLKLVESDIRGELTDLLMYLMPMLGFETEWLAPGVGPVKIETPNGIAELIDYEIE